MGDLRRAADDAVLGSWRANHTRGPSGWTIGGTSRLSRARLTFTPGPFSRWLPWGRSELECPLTDATHIGAGPRPLFSWINGPRRFGVVHDGILDLFEARAKDVDTIVDAIRAALEAARRTGRSPVAADDR